MKRKREYLTPVALSAKVELLASVAVYSNTSNELPVFTEDTPTDWNFFD